MEKTSAVGKQIPISNLIGTSFGSLWASAGSLVFSGTLRGMLLTLTLVVTVFLVVRLSLTPAAGRPRNRRFRRWPYIVAVLLEFLAIIVVSALLPRYGFERYLPQATGIIVGIHFVGLWKASQSSRFLLIAAGMCLVSAGSILLPPLAASVRIGDVVTGFGNALILWIGAGGRD